MYSSYEVTPFSSTLGDHTKRCQRTIHTSVEMSGVGLFSGLTINMRLVPAPPGTGIVFKRVDLKNEPEFSATVDNVCGTPRCTNLGDGKSIVQSVEHILSALKAYEIDNLYIEVDGPEVPAGDGSSLVFVEMLERGQIVTEEPTLPIRHLEVPVYWSKGDVHMIALPSETFRLSYTLSYPNHPILSSQFHTIDLTHDTYRTEIAQCRTFSLYEEIVPLLDQGVIKGGSLDSGVIIKGDKILNPEGLRFKNEMARHKVLDLIGDLSLVGFPFVAHIIAIRSGHFSNTMFAKLLRESLVEIKEDA
ncbi:MAG: UDP-3-O-acyl-N-acetylglucosamine deacetylase [Simkaniaceae bacterium]|nr:UDP-3-O-acyl-N-acetylglucosamine deacetylase [Simkaniaceae bacterium]